MSVMTIKVLSTLNTHTKGPPRGSDLEEVKDKKEGEDEEEVITPVRFR